MSYQTMIVETGEDHIGVITLNRPLYLNTFNTTMALELEQALEELDQTIKEVYSDPDPVRGIAPRSGQGARILNVDYDGVVEFDGYYLKYIQ